MADYNQWTEIEGDAKQLQELVQSQKNKINEIVSLISETSMKKENKSFMNILSLLTFFFFP